jgi:hypothetical protein
MPRIADHYLDCVVYLYPDHRHANDGEGMGGSGFLLRVQDAADLTREQIYVVTNWHVVESGHLTVRLNTQDGVQEIIDTDEPLWFRHPNGDDLAIFPLAHHAQELKFGCISSFNILNKTTVDLYNIGPGDDVFTVGRFINHDGKQRNLPTVRFGSIAQMPWEPVRISDFDQESFLIETRSLFGSSGSPVILELPTFAPARPGSKITPHIIHPQIRQGPWLVGIAWGYAHGDKLPIYKHSSNKARPEETPYYAVSNSGLMVVVPGWKLQELLDHPPVVAARKLAMDEAKKKTGSTV